MPRPRPLALLLLASLCACRPEAAPGPAALSFAPGAAEAGASETSDSNPYLGGDFLGEERIALVPRTGVLVLTAAQAEAADVSEDGVVLPAAGNEDALGWAPGRLVASAPAQGPGSRNPFGFARRVLSAVLLDGKIVLRTETVPLSELVSGELQVRMDERSSRPVDLSAMDLDWVAGALYEDADLSEMAVEPLRDDAPDAVAPADPEPGPPPIASSVPGAAPMGLPVAGAVRGLFDGLWAAAQATGGGATREIETPRWQAVTAATLRGLASLPAVPEGSYRGPLFRAAYSKPYQWGKHAYEASIRGQGSTDVRASFEAAVQVGASLPERPALVGASGGGGAGLGADLGSATDLGAGDQGGGAGDQGGGAEDQGGGPDLGGGDLDSPDLRAAPDLRGPDLRGPEDLGSGEPDGGPGAGARYWLRAEGDLDLRAQIDLDLSAGVRAADVPADLLAELRGAARQRLLGDADLRPAGAWKRTLAVSAPVTRTVMAGPVPVVITLTRQVDLECGFEARAALQASLAVEHQGRYRLAASYHERDGLRTEGPYYDRSFRASYRIAARGAAVVVCGLVPRVSVFFYDTVALHAGLRGSLVGRVSYDEGCAPGAAQAEGRPSASIAVGGGLQASARRPAPGASLFGLAGVRDRRVVGPIEPWNREIRLWSKDLARGEGLGTCSPLCRNLDLDEGIETDVDCGSQCGACGRGRRCRRGSDCASGLFCSAGRCGPSSCADGALSGQETDVDCGGPCGPCAAGQACVVGSDCASGVCRPAERPPGQARSGPRGTCAP